MFIWSASPTRALLQSGTGLKGGDGPRRPTRNCACRTRPTAALTAFGLGLLLSLILWHGHVRNPAPATKAGVAAAGAGGKESPVGVPGRSRPLTGLFSRRRFDDLCSWSSRASLANRSRWNLLMVDTDHFKYINGLSGHPFGDEVIRHAASLLRGSARAATAWRAWAGRIPPAPARHRRAAGSQPCGKTPRRLEGTRWRRRTACSA
ncbi:diguanylate cyclase [Pseudomonas aeruginosa]|nr:diguanylate cyclase [Pseudomonas aeruginosa]